MASAVFVAKRFLNLSFTMFIIEKALSIVAFDIGKHNKFKTNEDMLPNFG